MTTERSPRRAVGPRLRRLLAAVLAIAAGLAANSIYLAAITFTEWTTGRGFQNYFYQYMFLAHLALGLALIVPFLVFLIVHLRAARGRRNRLALRTGYALGGASLALLATGLVLVRFGIFEIRDPRVRTIAYWCHALLPLAAASLYLWHRERGGRFRIQRAWASFGAVAAPLGGAPRRPRDESASEERHAERGRAIFFALARAHERRTSAAAARADDERVLPDVPRRRVRELVPQRASLQLVQQSVLSGERQGNARGPAAARRQQPRQPLVRRMPRSGAAVERHLRHGVARRTDRAHRPGGDHLHGLPRASRR